MSRACPPPPAAGRWLRPPPRLSGTRRAWLARVPRVRGSAVAVAGGITGLKTTHGRIPLAGVGPLAPSMDTISPMARDVAGVAAGLALLEPGFSVDVTAAARVGRVRPGGFDVDPVIDAEAVISNQVLLADPARRDLLGPRVRASLQLIGGPNAEALQLATGAMIEAAVKR